MFIKGVWFVVLILSEFGCLLLLASRVPYTVVLLLGFFLSDFLYAFKFHVHQRCGVVLF